MDRYLEQTLKNWAAQEAPPENARARLLLLAASAASMHNEIPNAHFEQRYPHTHDIYGMHNDEPASILDLVWSLGMPQPGPRMA